MICNTMTCHTRPDQTNHINMIWYNLAYYDIAYYTQLTCITCHTTTLHTSHPMRVGRGREEIKIASWWLMTNMYMLMNKLMCKSDRTNRPRQIPPSSLNTLIRSFIVISMCVIIISMSMISAIIISSSSSSSSIVSLLIIITLLVVVVVVVVVVIVVLSLVRLAIGRARSQQPKTYPHNNIYIYIYIYLFIYLYIYIYIYSFICLYLYIPGFLPPGYSSSSGVFRCFLLPGEILKLGVGITFWVPKVLVRDFSHSFAETYQRGGAAYHYY